MDYSAQPAVSIATVDLKQQPRRNPTRTARPPPGLDLDTWDFADSTATTCGRVSPDRVRAVLAGEGADLIRHPEDHELLWIQRSEFCPNGGLGMFLRPRKEDCELDTSWQSTLGIPQIPSRLLTGRRLRDGQPVITCSVTHRTDMWSMGISRVRLHGRM